MLQLKLSLRKPILLLCYFLIISLIPLVPLYSNDQLPAQYDLMNHLASIVQASTALQQGQFPLRFTPLSTWYYPYFQFYSPSAYLLAGAIYRFITPSNPFMAFKILIYMALTFASIYVYRLSFFIIRSHPAALIAALVFLLTPYLNILISQLFGLNEIIALCLLPYIFYYLLLYFLKEKKTSYFLLISFSYYLLITIHLITFIYGTILFVFFLFLLTIRTHNWQGFLRTLLCLCFGILLALWFLLPIIQLSASFNISSTYYTADKIFHASPFLLSLLSPTSIKHINGSLYDRAHANIGMPILVAFFYLLYVIFNNPTLLTPRLKFFLMPLMSTFILFFILTWSPVNFWQFLPPQLWVIQYTMRGMGYLILIGALLFACMLYVSYGKICHDKDMIVIIFLLLCTTSFYLLPLPISSTTPGEIKKKPIFIFNPDSYLLNTLEHPELVHYIDHYILYKLLKNGSFQFNTPFYLPKSLIDLAYQPKLSIEGYIPPSKHLNQMTFVVLMNNQIVAKRRLTSGIFSIKLPLNLKKKSKKFYVIELKLIQHTPVKQVKINAKTIQLEGFFNRKHYLAQAVITPFCQRGLTLQCNMKVPKNIHFLELPFYYYPHMLTITLNQHPIPYDSILHGNDLLTVVKPLAGHLNRIEVKFSGIKLANYGSLLGWSIWSVFLITHVIIRIRKMYR